jgi:hypothetical protein
VADIHDEPANEMTRRIFMIVAGAAFLPLLAMPGISWGLTGSEQKKAEQSRGGVS